ncbi:polysaccharide biosynthesis/export family protein [Granulicella pectinivorans]|nr:SLBB domain-containing protein [Granulicella pectinivorans]
MKRRAAASLAFCGFLAFSHPSGALASSFYQTGQGSLQQQAPAQTQSSDPSQDNGRSSLDDTSGPTLRAAPVLNPTQDPAGTTQLLQDQLADRDKSPQGRTAQGPPVQLSDFQRLVAASVGKVLPIYGANLFLNVPSTFAPVNRIPVTPDYVIGPGDELLIHAWGQVSLDGHFTVDRSGSVYIPRVGTVHVAGIPFDKITDFLRSQMSRLFQNFDLNINMGQLRSIQIFVVGEAKRPGSYTVSSLSTLVNAIFSSGGPTSTGSMRNIQVRRGKETIATFDFYDLLLKGDKSKDIALASGDVVYIPPVGPMVALAGSFDKPALYELKNESTIKDAIALSGGLATLARRRQIRIERVRQLEDTRSIEDVTLDDAGLSTPLLDGDILEVSPIIDRFKDAVTLRGNVANPRRFAWHPGMHIRDLIPDKEALLTREYWQQKNQLGLPILDPNEDIRRYAPDAPIAQVNGTGIAPSPTNSALALPNALDSDTNVHGVPSNGIPNRRATEDARTSGLTRSASVSLHNNASPEPSTSSPSGSAPTAASVSSAVTGVAGRFPVKNSVLLSAPEIDWAYAVIERTDKNDLRSHLLPFNLGRAILDGDPSQNLELQQGDVVTIFSKADIRVPQDQQTKLVRLEGEFMASGIYTAGPDENLRQLVARAGGITTKAYLYGSEFMRESARVIQQQRLNEYADDLERRVKLAEANSASNALNPQDQIADIAALQKARSIAAGLREVKASGRVVLSIRPDSNSLDDIPELPLEDGDTFVLPQRPLSIGVYGSVYTPTQFLYDTHRRARDYIHLAGGSTRTADTARSYIIRADGSVVSRQFSTALFTGNFESTHLFPGDTVVVPEQVNKRPLLRNLVDVATIVGQFGLGIAAINVLK